MFYKMELLHTPVKAFHYFQLKNQKRFPKTNIIVT